MGTGRRRVRRKEARGLGRRAARQFMAAGNNAPPADKGCHLALLLPLDDGEVGSAVTLANLEPPCPNFLPSGPRFSVTFRTFRSLRDRSCALETGSFHRSYFDARYTRVLWTESTVFGTISRVSNLQATENPEYSSILQYTPGYRALDYSNTFSRMPHGIRAEVNGPNVHLFA